MAGAKTVAGAVTGAALLTAYALTLAPGVTFWDAGEFIAAAHGLGIPHPPGTPLYVALARAWAALLPMRTALETNLLSAVLTAAAAAAVAVMVARWLGRAAWGIAAGIAAGAMASVWASATETEVYAASLLLSVAMLAAGDRAGREPGARAMVLLGFLFALAPAVHLSALVAAPAAIALAMRVESRADAPGVWTPGTADSGAGKAGAVGHGWRWWEGGALLSALVLAAGIGTVRPWLAGAGTAALVILAIVRAPLRRPAIGMLVAAAAGASALLILLVRAQHDPVLNQGDPSTFGSLLDVVGRRQYAVPGLWPRRAPLLIQIGNLFEYVDWQIALGLAPGVAPSITRTPFTVLFLALAVYGSSRHRELHRRSWIATAVLLLCASLGVVVYLNLRAGPSFGYGILPDDAPREPRERDYFFALAFFTWGIWAGIGAVAASIRLLRARAWPGVLVAALPIALNWRAVDRGRLPEAEVPRALAHEMLGAVPRDGILFVWGDNDTYPLWHAQQAEGVRTDVTVITIPLLGADWYRAELARRHGLVRPEDLAGWRGEVEEVLAIADRARELGRPVAAAVTLPGSYRRRIGEPWTLRGLAHVLADGGSSGAGTGPRVDAADVVEVPRDDGSALRIDTVAASAAAARVAHLLEAPRQRDVIETTPWAMRELLRCPGLAIEAANAGGGGPEGGLRSLDLLCNRR